MTIQKKKHYINDMKEKTLNFDQTAFHQSLHQIRSQTAFSFG